MIEIMNNEITSDYIIDNSIFRIWVVVEVVWQQVKVWVDTWKNSSNILYKWDIIQNISVWWYVKIKKWFEEMIWKIEGELVKELNSENNKNYLNNKNKISRILNIKILWFLEWNEFKRWIKELPLIDNTCYLLRKDEFNKIHKFVDEKEDEPLNIWTLEYDDGVKIELWINKLFASHIWIFWNTWSWKSYTLAKIYRELFKKYKKNLNFRKNAKFFLIDFNWEYIDDGVIVEKVDKDDVNIIYKDTFNLTTRKTIDEISECEKFPVEEETLKSTSFWSIFLDATEKTQMPFIDRSLKDTYIETRINDDVSFINLIKEKIVDLLSNKENDWTIIWNFLYELSRFLNNETLKNVADFFSTRLYWWNRLDFFFKDETGKVFPSNDWEKFYNIIDDQILLIKDINLDKIWKIRKIWLKVIVKYYDEMIRWFSNKEHLSPLIKRLEKRIYDLEKVLRIKDKKEQFESNFIIISLRNVNIDIRKMIPMLLSKELYENKRSDIDKNKSLHIIIDEAHNILSTSSERENKEWKDYRLETFEEIIKEWRKFWTFLTIASQRPSDISPTIISQLHNYFLHRLINENDLRSVEKTIAYLDKVSADSIPNLWTWVCILAWLMAQIPVVIKVWEIENQENQPQSQNINLLEKWED